MINPMNDKSIIEKVLIGAGIAYSFSNAYHGVRSRGQKFQYAGLSKHSPSHAQQKRDSKKAKNRGRG
jgi:hypothetical protein